MMIYYNVKCEKLVINQDFHSKFEAVSYINETIDKYYPLSDFKLFEISETKLDVNSIYSIFFPKNVETLEL